MFNSLDYRRFDLIGSDSDSDSAEDHSQPSKDERAAAEIIDGITRREQQGCGRIKIHPRDSNLPSGFTLIRTPGLVLVSSSCCTLV